MNYWQNLIDNGISYDYTELLITATGEEKWIRVIGEPVIYNDTVIFINGSFSDDTEEYNYLEKLKYNEETKIIN